MTTPKPLPADIEMALREFEDAVAGFGDPDLSVNPCPENEYERAEKALRTLLSGYVGDAMKWRTGPPDDFFDAAPVEPEEGLTPEEALMILSEIPANNVHSCHAKCALCSGWRKLRRIAGRTP